MNSTPGILKHAEACWLVVNCLESVSTDLIFQASNSFEARIRGSGVE